MMEQPKPAKSDEQAVSQEPPKFVRPVNSVTDLIEGQPAHFETLLEPISDPKMQITW